MKINGDDDSITLPFNSTATLEWTSSNADYCQAYNDWNGLKSLQGTEQTANIAYPKTFTIVCSNENGSDSDTVRADIYQQAMSSSTIINDIGISGQNEFIAPVLGVTSAPVIYANAPSYISTGITDNFFIDSILIPLILSLLIVLAFKSKIAKLSKRFNRNIAINDTSEQAKQILNAKIAEIQKKEFGIT